MFIRNEYLNEKARQTSVSWDWRRHFYCLFSDWELSSANTTTTLKEDDSSLDRLFVSFGWMMWVIKKTSKTHREPVPG